MLSLPLIPPQQNTFRTQFSPRADSPPRQQNGQQDQHQRNQHAHRPNSSTANSNSTNTKDTRSPLALLAADEAAIAARKAAIRNFGAYWLRPPGVAKTLQAMNEEAAELAEQMELERQEQGMRDMQAQQQLEDARARAAETAGAGEDEDEEAEERDLDADIPDADAQDEDADADADESGVGDVTFNEQSMVDGSHVMEENMNQEDYAVMEEAELTGAARDEADLGIEHSQNEIVERNLDDSIPEAGSYQHTDTEVEDSDSESELNDSFAGLQSAARRSARQPQRVGAAGVGGGVGAVPIRGGLQARLRAQGAGLARSPGMADLSESSIGESSMLGSSPVVQRARGGRRGRGRLS